MASESKAGHSSWGGSEHGLSERSALRPQLLEKEEVAMLTASQRISLDSEQCRIVLDAAAVFSHVRRTFGMQDGATVWLLNLGGVRLGDGYSVLEPANVIAKYQAL